MVEAMVNHSRQCHPREACGLLAKDGSGRWQMAYPLTNRESSAHRFTIDPDEHFGAVSHAERNGWEIAGVFHSHPFGSSELSPTDRRQPHDPDWLHVVIGADGTLGMWRLG